MRAQLLGLLAESLIHAGSGQSASFVDLPVSREAATGHPTIPGSSLKGALLDLARRRWRPKAPPEGAPASDPADASGDQKKKEQKPRTRAEVVFGTAGHAGDLVVADARLVLLPVRSLTSVYAWVTCPYIIERLVRDHARAGLPVPRALDRVALNEVERGKALFNDGDYQFLEERQFAHQGALPAGLVELVAPLVAHEATRARLGAQMAVLHDHDFAWFARYGLAVAARNHLHEVKKTSENLWYEESLPPDSVLYALLCARGGDSLVQVSGLFEETPYLQVGGNETVGQGWFAVSFAGSSAGGGETANDAAGGAE